MSKAVGSSLILQPSKPDRDIDSTIPLAHSTRWPHVCSGSRAGYAKTIDRISSTTDDGKGARVVCARTRRWRKHKGTGNTDGAAKLCGQASKGQAFLKGDDP
jgi:hypothetical protein